MLSSATPRRITVTLRKPWLGWHPRPTVVFAGRGQPAQWGTGTWQLPDGDTTISVYIYNRMWQYGRAVIALDADSDVEAVEYRAPLLPFMPGSMRAVSPSR